MRLNVFLAPRVPAMASPACRLKRGLRVAVPSALIHSQNPFTTPPRPPIAHADDPSHPLAQSTQVRGFPERPESARRTVTPIPGLGSWI